MFARTQRLLLRPGFMEDAPALAAAIGDAAVIARLARVPFPYTHADAETFLAQPAEAWFPRFLIMRRTNGAPELIGGIGLSRDEEGRRNLGYWIRRDEWGQGFATEAGRAICAMADAAELGPIHAEHFADNSASGRVLAKLGFVPTGEIVRRRSPVDGCHDSIAYVRPSGDDAMWPQAVPVRSVRSPLAIGPVLQ